ncbi:transposase [Frankia sp. CcWB3]
MTCDDASVTSSTTGAAGPPTSSPSSTTRCATVLSGSRTAADGRSSTGSASSSRSTATPPTTCASPGPRRTGCSGRSRSPRHGPAGRSPAPRSRTPFRFLDYVATFGTSIPELVTATETLNTWLEEITNAVHHGISNAAAEGVNRLTKLIYRVAFGMSNVANQQLRARYTASRAARPQWRPTVTTHATAT